jgi:hypothetical protein
MNEEGCERKLSYSPGIFIGGLRRTTKNLRIAGFRA